MASHWYWKKPSTCGPERGAGALQLGADRPRELGGVDRELLAVAAGERAAVEGHEVGACPVRVAGAAADAHRAGAVDRRQAVERSFDAAGARVVGDRSGRFPFVFEREGAAVRLDPDLLDLVRKGLVVFAGGDDVVSPRLDERAGAGELLDPVVGPVRDVDVAGGLVDRDPRRFVELARAAARGADAELVCLFCAGAGAEEQRQRAGRGQRRTQCSPPDTHRLAHPPVAPCPA